VDEVKGAPVGEVFIYVVDFELAVWEDEFGLVLVLISRRSGVQDLDTQLVSLDNWWRYSRIVRMHTRFLHFGEKEGANLCREMFIRHVLEFAHVLDLYETSLLNEIDSPYPRPGKISASISSRSTSIYQLLGLFAQD
jgi:hypothetical protein